MGESEAELEKRIKEQESKVVESGLYYDLYNKHYFWIFTQYKLHLQFYSLLNSILAYNLNSILFTKTGLSFDEISNEFSRKLDNLERQNSTTDHLLLDLNKRYQFEHETLSKKLQGIASYTALNAGQRERQLFSLIQARLRGIQESEFSSASLSVGLSERIQPLKNDRWDFFNIFLFFWASKIFFFSK